VPFADLTQSVLLTIQGLVTRSSKYAKDYTAALVQILSLQAFASRCWIPSA
jgi:hypothetical protein